MQPKKEKNTVGEKKMQGKALREVTGSKTVRHCGLAWFILEEIVLAVI